MWVQFACKVCVCVCLFVCVYVHVGGELEKKQQHTDPPVYSACHCVTFQELEKQEKKLNFDMCIKSISLLRYVTDHLQG